LTGKMDIQFTNIPRLPCNLHGAAGVNDQYITIWNLVRRPDNVGRKLKCTRGVVIARMV
jgi:hypothetical protein